MDVPSRGALDVDRRQTRTATARPLPAIAALVAALLLVLVPAPGTAVAAPDGGIEARFVQLVNAERASAGLPALRVAGDLTSVGRRHAVRMAERNDLHHNPNLGGDVGGWDKVGENVGRGPDIDRIHAAFMASEGHRRNILDPEWVEVGVGVEVVDGGLWVTELFRLPSGASAPAPAPAPEPAAKAPAPAAPAPAADEPPAAADAAPATAREEAPEAPAPREVPEPPLPVDRVTLVLTRLSVDDDGPPPA